MLRRAKEDARLHRFTERSASPAVRRQVRGRTPPVQLGKALLEMFSEHGLWSETEATLLNCWLSVAGPMVGHVDLAGFDRESGTLTLCESSTAWITQVKLLTDALIQRINVELGSQTVRRIRLVKRDPTGPPPPSALPPPALPGGTRARRWQPAPPLPDPAIQAAVQRQRQCLPHEPAGCREPSGSSASTGTGSERLHPYEGP
ncbi:DUF721 domain-containing protein [Streptomyces sp. NPDC052101]|uniref:DUF721 domain-containing protein n=1 Tax=Streptomyces sp. NPDC052101 TaxID=3155763 RepID=UPI0034315962